ncbi:uncharacterized protein PITG_00126 [Phytophthora infestans T30-4]|uniref:Uncharacterized protein n=1 Tax=Phytophthora infestans (strain T30-4) TaxID=403677 RepID=D0MSY3_PHYIT|nr:uncharacterized protein PITG_00126 [Phytophthora infestans T30-4]EEY57567.1 hypothetical protein PITG_00126 [Phytophthora infestans T30-4]|eukprot:XP_002908753.1 hypothetical protein PITG_00126 [Phytophthora infestans T30-4]
MLYDDATVRRVLRAAHEGQDWRDVALKNDVKLRTAYRWINADLLVLEAITPELCYKCSLHTMKFHARAIQMKDMPVGE